MVSLRNTAPTRQTRATRFVFPAMTHNERSSRPTGPAFPKSTPGTIPIMKANRLVASQAIAAAPDFAAAPGRGHRFARSLRPQLCAGGLGLLLLTGCAFDLIHVKLLPAQLDRSQPPKNSWTLARDTSVSLQSGFSTRMKSNTRWNHAGSIVQGDVYQTKDQVVTVEASNMHEAWVVVNDGRLVGFYLPVERAFTPASSPVALQIRGSNTNP